MRSLRWILMFVVVLLHKYANTTSIAEEINSEVSDMRELVKNDPQQVPEMQDPMDSEAEDPLKDEQADDVESSQSEIVETHVLPEDSEPDELNAQIKRPRRRRRRRRRKRPKPTASPEELEAYYTVPEEEIKRKPAKYRPQEETDEPLPESSTVPRRRNAKRRRRPLKRPPTIDDYSGTAEGFSDNVTATDEQPEQPPFEQHPQEIPKVTKPQPHFIEVVETEPPPPAKVQLPTTAKKVPFKKEKEPQHVLQEATPPKLLHPNNYTKLQHPREIDEAVVENEFAKFESAAAKTKTPVAAPVPEIRKVEPADQTSVRRRKRPLGDPTEPSKPEQSEPKVAESVDTKHQLQPIHKNEVKLDDEVKNNLVEQRKFKIDERVKQMNDTKKDAFKLRRLPPISAILRYSKNRPKNETSTKAPLKNDAFKIKESITNEILTHAATLDQLNHRIANETDEDLPVVATSTARPNKTETSSKATVKTNHFEFPIIAYTEQKLRQTTTAPASTSSTESTAFIYIPCNKTEVSAIGNHQNVTSKPADPVTSTESQISTQQSDNVFDSAAIKQLEKLLQAEVETASASVQAVNGTQANQTQVNAILEQLDANALESELNLLFQNGGVSTKQIKSSSEQNYREPKWFVDSRRKNEASSTEKPLIYDKEIVISYTSTTVFPGSFNDVDPPAQVFHGNELSLQLRNNSYRRVATDSVLLHKNKQNYNERKKLPLAVKSAIIVSGAILALAVLGFFALLLSCKIRQAKSRMKCHRELYRERFQNSEFRQSSRSTSPVVSKSSNYNARNFPNNIQSNVASNRNYYLWQTLRKTFQYD